MPSSSVTGGTCRVGRTVPWWWSLSFSRWVDSPTTRWDQGSRFPSWMVDCGTTAMTWAGASACSAAGTRVGTPLVHTVQSSARSVACPVASVPQGRHLEGSPEAVATTNLVSCVSCCLWSWLYPLPPCRPLAVSSLSSHSLPLLPGHSVVFLGSFPSYHQCFF